MSGSLSVILHGGYFDQLGEKAKPVEIDSRYTEEITNPKPAVDQSEIVDHAGHWLEIPPTARLACLYNISGRERTTYPTEEEAAELAKRVLLIGVGKGHQIDGDPPDTVLRVLPVLCGVRPGGCQALWLSPGAQVFVRSESPTLLVDARVQIFCG